MRYVQFTPRMGQVRVRLLLKLSYNGDATPIAHAPVIRDPKRNVDVITPLESGIRTKSVLLVQNMRGQSWYCTAKNMSSTVIFMLALTD